MANDNKNIEQVFKDGFKNFEHDVSSHVWENIDQDLFGDSSGNSKSSKFGFNLEIIGAVPLLLLTLLAAIYQSTVTPEEVLSDNKSIHITEEKHMVDATNATRETQKAQQKEIEKADLADETNEERVLIIEDENSDDVEELIKNDKEIKVENQDNTDQMSETNKMPTLSEKPYINYDYYKNQESQIYSKFCISKLKNGVLLVRLKTRKKGIDALLKSGQKKKAKKLQKEVREDNLAVVEAFKNNYNFSDVYFFYSSSSEEIRNRSLNNVFLNENLEVDKRIKLDPSKQFYMILDIGMLKIPSDDNTNHFSAALSRALVIKDRDFEQLYRPFPFYISAANEKKIEKQVSKLNQSLTKYHESEQGSF